MPGRIVGGAIVFLGAVVGLLRLYADQNPYRLVGQLAEARKALNESGADPRILDRAILLEAAALVRPRSRKARATASATQWGGFSFALLGGLIALTASDQRIFVAGTLMAGLGLAYAMLMGFALFRVLTEPEPVHPMLGRTLLQYGERATLDVVTPAFVRDEARGTRTGSTVAELALHRPTNHRPSRFAAAAQTLHRAVRRARRRT